MNEPRWQVGDVLYTHYPGTVERCFIAEEAPDSARCGDGCYSPNDRGATRKATIADIQKCIAFRAQQVHREWHILNDLLVMMRKVCDALSTQERGELEAYRILDAAGRIQRG